MLKHAPTAAAFAALLLVTPATAESGAIQTGIGVQGPGAKEQVARRAAVAERLGAPLPRALDPDLLPRKEKRKGKRLKHRHHRRGIVYYYDPYGYYGPDTYEAVPAGPPPKPAEVQPDPPPPAEPPSAAAPGAQMIARGGELPQGLLPGQRVPDGTPHVSLPWRVYELPEPPAGRVYARVGRQVVLMTLPGRRVLDIIR